MSGSSRISLSVHQITRLHIPEGRHCCADGSENLKAWNFRMFLQTKDRPLYPSARETSAKHNSTTRGSKLHNDVTTTTTVLLLPSCRPLQQTSSILLVPESVCVHLVGLLGPEIRPLQGITYRHSYAVGLQTVGTVASGGRQYTLYTVLPYEWRLCVDKFTELVTHLYCMGAATV